MSSLKDNNAGPSTHEIDRRGLTEHVGVDDAHLASALAPNLRAVIDGMSEGFALLDADFTILDVNAETMRLDSRTRAQIIGRSHWDVYPGTETSEIGALYKKAMRERVAVSLEHRHQWEDGRISWLDMRAYPVQPDRLAIFFRDVTERYDAEERFRDLADNISAVFYVHDLDDRRISYVSPAYETIWQGKANDLYADPMAFMRPIHSDDRAAVETAVSRQFVGENTEVRYRITRADGSIRHIHDRAFVTPKATQGRRRVVGIAEDVTETTEARLQLARNAKTFESLVSDNPFGIYVVNSDFKMLHVSQGCAKVFAGISPLLGRDLAEIQRELWPEPFASEAIAHFRHTLATGEPYISHRTVEGRRNIDAVEAYDWRTDRIVLPDGKFGVVCYFYDLSAQVELETSLRKALDDKDMLVREIDHRVRNSLTLVSALLSMQAGSSPTDEVKQALKIAAARMQAVARIHERLYRGKQVGVVQFDDYLREVCGDLQASLARDGLRLELETVSLRMAVDHAIPLGLVINELVTNAFKHCQGEDISISVTLASNGEGYELVIADDGAGMPQDFRAGTGKGLGMQVVQLLSRQIGGQLEVPAPGQAAHFRVIIPSAIAVSGDAEGTA
jgi:PAS domain S-box-containing protein